MTDHSVKHSTFTLERTYAASPAAVFAAWSDRDTKAKWFAAEDGRYSLDFRVGGTDRRSWLQGQSRAGSVGATSSPSPATTRPTTRADDLASGLSSIQRTGPHRRRQPRRAGSVRTGLQ